MTVAKSNLRLKDWKLPYKKDSVGDENVVVSWKNWIKNDILLHKFDGWTCLKKWFVTKIQFNLFFFHINEDSCFVCNEHAYKLIFYFLYVYNKWIDKVIDRETE